MKTGNAVALLGTGQEGAGGKPGGLSLQGTGASESNPVWFQTAGCRLLWIISESAESFLQANGAAKLKIGSPLGTKAGKLQVITPSFVPRQMFSKEISGIQLSSLGRAELQGSTGAPDENSPGFYNVLPSLHLASFPPNSRNCLSTF